MGRAGAHPRGFVRAAVASTPEAARALADGWGLPAAPGTVAIRRYHDRVTALVSRDQDPLLLYDDNQFLYPDYRRIPATRFQQRYFLIGSIYLGRTSPKYILHDTWKWFDEDMRQSNPAAFLETGDLDSPPFADYVKAHFEPEPVTELKEAA